MATVDIVLIIVIGLFGIIGMRRGFLSQVVLLAAFLVGIWLTIRFSGYISKVLISRFDTSAEYTPLWSFGLTFAAVVVAVYASAHLIKGAMRIIRMQWLDNLLGLAFGMLKGALLVSVFFALLIQAGIMQNLVSPMAARGSILYGPVCGIAPGLFPYLKDFGAAAWEQFAREAAVE